jgi:hypothetical protein
MSKCERNCRIFVFRSKLVILIAIKSDKTTIYKISKNASYEITYKDVILSEAKNFKSICFAQNDKIYV